MSKKRGTDESKISKKKVSAKKTAIKKKAAAKKAVSKKVANYSNEKKASAAAEEKQTAAVKKKAPEAKTNTAAKAAKKPVISDRERYEMIQTMAYYRAEKRNFAPGNEQQDWLECEQIVDDMLQKQEAD